MVLPHEPEFQQAYDELVSAVEDSTLFKKNHNTKSYSSCFYPRKNHSIQSHLGKRQR